jgi:hypothetical protein
MRTNTNQFDDEALKKVIDEILNYHQTPQNLQSENSLETLNRLINNKIATDARGDNLPQKITKILTTISKNIFSYLQNTQNRKQFIKNLSKLHSDQITYLGDIITEDLLQKIIEDKQNERTDMNNKMRIILFLIAIPLSSAVGRVALLAILPVLINPNVFLAGANRENFEMEEFMKNLLDSLKEAEPQEAIRLSSATGIIDDQQHSQNARI